MNKDVIYIEPEDDITDIISKLENSKEKIVALVPPKKAGVLRSTVNIRLITKSASNANKTIVFVTTDPSVIKMAALAQIPVTKDLKTAPTIPSSENVLESKNIEVIREENSDESSQDEPEQTHDDSKEPEKLQNQSETEKPPKESKRNEKKSPKFIQWIKDHKKISITCVCLLFILICAFIWAFVIAPAVSISVTIKTTTSNFSENVSLISDIKSEKAEDGIFYYETKKKETKQEATFTATGSKNNGEKATGVLVIYASFPISAIGGGSASVSTNDIFTFNGLNFRSTENVTISWDGVFDSCDNSIKTASDYCIKSAEVKAIADAPGVAYNITASTSGWTASTSSVSAYAKTDFTGGTDNIITIVSQSDIDKAKESLKIAERAKETFLEEIAEDETILIVNQSYKETTSDAVSTPAVGEQVNSGVTPKITVTTTQTVLTLDRTKIEEFIFKKAKLSDDQKIYSISDPFIENLSIKDSSFTGKLKTTFQSGSKVTESDILENVKGKKVGEVKAILSSITGVVKDATKIETSYFWVNTVPNDPNKITINLNIEED